MASMLAEQLRAENEELAARVRELESNQRVLVDLLAEAFAQPHQGHECHRSVKHAKRREILDALGLGE